VAAVVATVLVGALSATVFVVAPVLMPVLAFDRGLADVQRWLAGSLLRLPVARPDRPRRRRGVLGFLAYHLADPVAWRAVGCFAVRIPAGAVQFAAGFLVGARNRVRSGCLQVFVGEAAEPVPSDHRGLGL
jgi:hypothetical protein